MATAPATISEKAAAQPQHPLLALRQQMEMRTTEFRNALPAHMPVERFQRVVLTSIQLNPDLLTVNRSSLWNACMRAAQDGLLPDGREAVIIPYKESAQYQPMVQGLLKRFRNSGQFKSITANVVREGEEFNYWIDENGEHVRHVPGDGDGKITKAYAMAQTKDGGVMVKVMSVADIDKRRNASRAKNSPMWNEWYEEAAQKTVLRNLSKRLPSATDLDDLMRRDEALYNFDTPALAAEQPKITDVNSALNAFSGSETKAESPSIQPPGETGDTIVWDENTRAAFDLGQQAKLKGVARRAVPPEYRTPEATALAKAWWSGWDAAEAPTQS